MSRPNRWLATTLAVLAVAGLAQCKGGKKSISQDVAISVIPDKPIVITADTTVLGNQISKPWFKFSVSMTNNSGQHLVIVAITAQVYTSGSTDSTTWAQDPASQSSTSDTTDCTYDRYLDLDTGKTATLGLPSSTTACNITTWPFYIGSLKTSPTGGYRYKVVVKPIGWFGTFDSPTDRFDNQFTFYTQ